MIGILDWGIGGLGFYAALVRARPSTRVVYFSDAGFTPYGKVEAVKLARRVREVLGVMRAEGATHVVIACNAASTVLPRLGVHGLAGELDTPAGKLWVTGIIEHALSMLRHERISDVGILGGARTIRSQAYARRLRARGVRVRQRIAQPLSAHVERGDLDSQAVHRDLDAILAPLASTPALLLACTHYAALAELLQARVPETRVLDPVDALVAWVLQNAWLGRASATDRFLTTGDPRAMQAAARKAFGIRLEGSKNPERLSTRFPQTWTLGRHGKASGGRGEGGVHVRAARGRMR